MEPGYEIVERDLTVEEYQRLRDAVGWSRLTDEAVAAGLPRGLFSVVVLHDRKAIGCGRLVGDGGPYFYLQDVIVLAEHRGRGLGRAIMEHVMGFLERHAEPGSFVGLMAAEDVAGFYEPYGFRVRPGRQPGMGMHWKRS